MATVIDGSGFEPSESSTSLLMQPLLCRKVSVKIQVFPRAEFSPSLGHAASRLALTRQSALVGDDHSSCHPGYNHHVLPLH